MRIEVWSDVVCPWCAIGRVRLRKAIAAAGIEADIIHRAFELDPDFQGTRSTHEVLAERYGSDADVETMTSRVRDLAALEGLDLRTAEALAANTFDAHRLLLWAQGQGAGEKAMDELVRAHFGAGADVSDHAVLLDVAARCGLDAAAARAMLESDAGALQVRSDEDEARELGIQGVPFFVFARRIGLSGAQPTEMFAKALAQAASLA